MGDRFIQDCENEPLEFSGLIQPHGFLVIVRGTTITSISQNGGEILGGSASEWVHGEAPHSITDLLRRAKDCEVGGTVQLQIQTETGFAGDSLVTRPGECEYLIEIYPRWVHRTNGTRTSNSERTGEILSAADLERQFDAIANKVYLWTSYQRTMYYRFMDNGDGEVLVEKRDEDVKGTFLGLRFPASDIPKIARALYVKTPWRSIRDSQAESIAVLGSSEEPPNLGLIDLRSASPVHRVYLANMGVRSSLSFPVVVDGKLFAMIAGHHSEVAHVATTDLLAVAEEVKRHGESVSRYLALEREQFDRNLGTVFERVDQLAYRSGGVVNGWPEISRFLKDLFEVDGVVLMLDDAVYSTGLQVDYQLLQALQEAQAIVERPIATWESISRQVPGAPLSGVAGAIAIRVAAVAGKVVTVFLLRGEHIQEIHWGGNPNKPVEYVGEKLTISPRNSFGRWVETREGYCKPWSPKHLALASRLHDVFCTGGIR